MESLWILTVIILGLSLGIDGSDDDSSSCEHCTPWKPASACSVSCGGGTQTLTSTCTKIVDCNTQPCPPPCIEGLDIAILLDKSGSIGKKSFRSALDFLRKLVEKFRPGTDGDHFGLITFQTGVRMVFKFADSRYQSKHALKQKIDQQMGPTSGYTRTDLALEMARDNLFTAAGGDRPDKANVVLVLTDGKPKSGDPETINFTEIIPNIQRALKAKKVTTIAVGVGTRVDNNNLQLIAGPGSPVFHVTDYSQLLTKVAEIKASVCSE